MIDKDFLSKAENGGFLSKQQVKILSGDKEKSKRRHQVSDTSLYNSSMKERENLEEVQNE